MLVIDASVGVEASLAADGFAALGEPLVAPPLLWSETVSVLHAAAWRGELEASHAEESLRRFLASPVEERRHRHLREEAWRIADALGWAKTYDAEYVALARLLSCPLVTVDGRLRRRAARVVEVLGPTEV